MVILTEKRTDTRRTSDPPVDGATGVRLMRRCYVILSISISQLSSTLTATRWHATGTPVEALLAPVSQPLLGVLSSQARCNRLLVPPL